MKAEVSFDLMLNGIMIDFTEEKSKEKEIMRKINQFMSLDKCLTVKKSSSGERVSIPALFGQEKRKKTFSIFISLEEKKN